MGSEAASNGAELEAATQSYSIQLRQALPRGLPRGMGRQLSLLKMTPAMRHAKPVRAFIQSEQYVIESEQSCSKFGAHTVRGKGPSVGYGPWYGPCTGCGLACDGLGLAWMRNARA